MAVIGAGYAGLPTALALYGRCQRITGIDIGEKRLAVIRVHQADLTEADKATLDLALGGRVS